MALLWKSVGLCGNLTENINVLYLELVLYGVKI